MDSAVTMPNLTVDGDRLWQSLMETAEIGSTQKGGIKRLTLTEEDRAVRDWLVRQCEALGCRTAIDEVGNMFFTRPGTEPRLDPIAIGSHLDTQPTGGKFDGILGVLAGLEILRSLSESHNEAESSTKEQCRAGAQTLLNAVLGLDRTVGQLPST
jgi:N-carbamoyl-L-amino-acid hydrolase